MRCVRLWAGRRSVRIIGVALLALGGLGYRGMVDAEPAGAAMCSLVYVTEQPPIIEKAKGGQYLTGLARVTNTSITSGCKLRVCAYEELDPGNWVASGCTWNLHRLRRTRVRGLSPLGRVRHLRRHGSGPELRPLRRLERERGRPHQDHLLSRLAITTRGRTPRSSPSGGSAPCQPGRLCAPVGNRTYDTA